MLIGNVTDVSERFNASIFRARQGYMTLKVEALHQNVANGLFTSQHGIRSQRTPVFTKTSVVTKKKKTHNEDTVLCDIILEKTRN
jgi:hypothetical protein